MRLHRADGQRDGARGVGAYREQDPQVRRRQLLPQPGQRGRQGGLPGVTAVPGVEVDEGDLLHAVERGRERGRGLVVPLLVGAGGDPEGRDGAAARREPLREVQRAVGGFQRLAVLQRGGGRAVGRPEVALDHRGGAEVAAVAQREVGRAVPAGGVARHAPLEGIVTGPVASEDVGAHVLGEVGLVGEAGPVHAVLVVVAGAVDGRHHQHRRPDEVPGDQRVGYVADPQHRVPGQRRARGAVEHLHDGEPDMGVPRLAVLRRQVQQGAPAVAAVPAGQGDPADAAGLKRRRARRRCSSSRRRRGLRCRRGSRPTAVPRTCSTRSSS